MADNSEIIKRINYLRNQGIDDETIGRNLAELGGVDYDAAKIADESPTDMLVRLITPQEQAGGQSELQRFQMLPTGKKLAIGVGKGMTDLAQGVRQLVGADTSQDVAAKRERDAAITGSPVANTYAAVGETAPLLAVPVGALGSLAARGMNLLKMVRGAKAAETAVADSALIGAAAGGIRPVGSDDESRAKNVATGMAVGAAIPVAVNVARSGSQAIGNIVRTPEEAAAKIIANTASDPVAARAALGATEVLVPGSVPTTGQATRDLGLLSLERSLRQRNPADWTADDIARNAARLKELESVTGAARLEEVTAARKAIGDAMYEPLKSATVKPDADFAKLMANPVMKDAWKEAQAIADIEGVSLTAADQITGRGLHYLKKGLDGLLDKQARRSAVGEGLSKDALRAAKGVAGKFDDWLETRVPEYQAARSAYRQASIPVNKAEAGKAILARPESGVKNVTGAPVLTPSDFNKKMAANLSNKYGEIFTPTEVERLANLGKDLERSVLAETVKGTKGSDTVQNAIGQQTVANTLRQTPIVGEFLAARVAGKDSAAAEILDQAMRDPAKAKQLLDMVKVGERSKVAALLEKGRHALTRAAVVQTTQSAP